MNTAIEITSDHLAAQIVKEFPFFPRIHALAATRPNVQPPCITTGVGPNGAETTILQEGLALDPLLPSQSGEDDEGGLAQQARELRMAIDMLNAEAAKTAPPPPGTASLPPTAHPPTTPASTIASEKENTPAAKKVPSHTPKMSPFATTNLSNTSAKGKKAVSSFESMLSEKIECVVLQSCSIIISRVLH